LRPGRVSLTHARESMLAAMVTGIEGPAFGQSE
jgi:hypothetical protein